MIYPTDHNKHHTHTIWVLFRWCSFFKKYRYPVVDFRKSWERGTSKTGSLKHIMGSWFSILPISKSFRFSYKLNAFIVSFIVSINVFLCCQFDKTTACTFYPVLIVFLYSPSCYGVVGMFTLASLGITHYLTYPYRLFNWITTKLISDFIIKGS